MGERAAQRREKFAEFVWSIGQETSLPTGQITEISSPLQFSIKIACLSCIISKKMCTQTKFLSKMATTSFSLHHGSFSPEMDFVCLLTN